MQSRIRGRPPQPLSEDPTEASTRLTNRKKWREYYYNLTDYESWSRTARNNSMKRARNSKLYHNLTTQQCLHLLPDDMLCPVLGIPLTIAKGKAHIQRHSATIDRIDSDGPYTMDNVHVVSNLANRGKSHLTLEEMVQLGLWAQARLDAGPSPKKPVYKVGEFPDWAIARIEATECDGHKDLIIG